MKAKGQLDSLAIANPILVFNFCMVPMQQKVTPHYSLALTGRAGELNVLLLMRYWLSL